MDVLIEAAVSWPLRTRISWSRSPATSRAAAPGGSGESGERGRVDTSERADLLADVFVMACRTRWAGLEQEGFGIVFLEAAAAGVPQIAGDSGGSARRCSTA